MWVDDNLIMKNFYDPARLDRDVKALEDAFNESNLLIFGGTDDAAILQLVVGHGHGFVQRC